MGGFGQYPACSKREWFDVFLSTIPDFMPADLLVYQTYPNQAVAQGLLTLLDDQRIVYTTDHAPARFNAALGMASDEQFVVRLRPDDFTRVRQLEEKQAADSLGELPSDYYLFAFSNAELWELLAQPDAWSSHDVALATRLLRERGETLTDEALLALRTRHTAALAAPDASPTGWIVAGYALSVLGGILGMAIGWSLWRYRKTLPDGRTVPGFSETARYHGRVMLALGSATLALGLGLRLLVL